MRRFFNITLLKSLSDFQKPTSPPLEGPGEVKDSVDPCYIPDNSPPSIIEIHEKPKCNPDILELPGEV